jgi:hypothetical protein
VVFVFAAINMLYYTYRFVYIETPMHPWDEANFVMVNDLSDMLLNSVCHYFIEDFCIDVYSVLLFGGVFIWFCDECNTGFIE